MIFNLNKHNYELYNISLTLSRNLFFYKKINLADNFETRIYLMFFHFSIFMIVTKKKGSKFDQKTYDQFFHNIEYNLRELGFGDVTVNKKMKEFNKILYDILLKLDLNKDNNDKFEINVKLIKNYFSLLNNVESTKLDEFKGYFLNFYNFCFEQSLDNMLEEAINYRY